MHADPNDLTAPILDRAAIDELRRTSTPRHAEPAPPPAPGAWLALVVLGNLIVLAMIVLVVLWS